MLNKKIFMERFLILSEIYDKKYSQSTIDAYYSTIQDSDDEKFKIAITEIIKNRVYSTFPKPAELREQIFGSKTSETTYNINIALEKFRKALKWSTSVMFDDPYIHKAIKLMGGWIMLTTQKEEQRIWIEKEFVNIYANLIEKKAECIDVDEVLYNKRDLINIYNGLQILPITIIGDSAKTKKWQEALIKRKENDDFGKIENRLKIYI